MADIYFYEMDEVPQQNMMPQQMVMQPQQMQQMMQLQRMMQMQGRGFGPQMRCNNSGNSGAVCILIILIIIIIIIIIYVFCRSNNYNYDYNGYNKNGFLASPEAIRDFNKVKSMDPKSPYTEFKLNIPNYDASKHQHIKQKLTAGTLNADDFDNA
uniref:Uncharacterized protein n=1 Tax=viral metagenome TaxID=1070528 RepID=A0A6C0I132_9ZZZZ